LIRIFGFFIYTIIQQPYGANGLQTLKTVLKKQSNS